MDFLLSAISEHKYLVLFPLAIVEGPIITIIAGLLCSIGVLNAGYALPILVLGDTIGDSFYYALGRWSQSPAAKRISAWVGIRDGILEEVKSFFRGNPVRMIFLSKIFLGVGVVGLVLSGNAKLPFGKFIGVCFGIAIGQSLVYMIIGFLFGQALITINYYMNWVATSGVILFFLVLIFIGIRSLKKVL